jgi:hypothetical protein
MPQMPQIIFKRRQKNLRNLREKKICGSLRNLREKKKICGNLRNLREKKNLRKSAGEEKNLRETK